MKSQSRWINLLLVICSLTLCFLVLEIIFGILAEVHKTYPLVYLRTENPRIWLWSYDEQFNSVPDWNLRLSTPFADIRYDGNVNEDPSLAGLNYREVPMATEVVLNSRGFRDREFNTIEPDARVTLVIGDSFCFGQGVRVQDRFSNRIEDVLNRGGGPPERFINLCRAGANIRQVYKNLEENQGLFSHVDRIIYTYVLNDPIPSEGVDSAFKNINDLMHLRTPNLKKVHHVFRLLDSKFLNWVLGRLTRRTVSRQTVKWYHDLHSREPGWTETKDYLKKIKHLADERGVELDLVIFPLLYHLQNYPFRDIHETIKKTAEEMGIRTIDLLPVFEGREASQFWVHPTDFHPNDKAHRMTADFLLRTLYPEKVPAAS